jgi:hypothetical protein
MSLSIDAVTEPIETDENESPLGKRKSDTPSESCRSGKRSPLSDVKAFGPTMNYPVKTSSTPMKPCAAVKKSATPYSSSKFIPRVSKEEVEATDEGRASVNKLSAWLASESAKKTKKPPTIVPAPNPVRFRMKPKINKEDVEATDDKRVSVKTLSAWISDDPFEQKKLRHIRSGVQVINKSRVFETDKKKIDVQVEVGSVHEKQAWLSGAFKHEDGRPPMNKDTMQITRPYKNKPKQESPDKALMSVTEKKKWLNNAFKKNDNGIEPTKSFDSLGGTPTIFTCASADDAKEEYDFPPVTQRSSYDGAASQPGNKSPVRLYRQSEVKTESPESCLKTVHDKQEWLANAFKAHPASKACLAKELKVDAAPMADTIPSGGKLKQIDNQAVEVKEQTKDVDVVSVADRAKWLRGAFSK